MQQLLDIGHDVVVLDTRPPTSPGALWKPLDIQHLNQMVQATRDVDVVYHLAAISNVNVAYNDPLGCVDANIRGTATVLEAARLNKLRRVLFASTVWVYQASLDHAPTEDACFAPAQVGHLYTASKIAGEMLLHSYQKLYGVPYTILRYGIPYGPHMRDELLIPAFLKKVLTGEPLVSHGDGSQFRKFIYVEDLARGNVAALAAAAENKTYNLEGNEKVTVLEGAQALDRALGEVRIQFEKPRPGDLAGVEIDSERALLDLGWQPSVSFEEGLRRTVAWFLTQPGVARSTQRARVPA